MATVPVVTAPSVTPQNLPDVRQQTPYRLMQAGDIGPGNVKDMGRGLLNAGNDLMQMATATQIQTNEARGKEFDANLMGGHQAILYGSPEAPNSGYLNLKGKAAVDAYGDTVKKLQQVGVDLSQGLDNPAQQDAVKSTATLRTQAAIVQATEHMVKQSNVYQQSAAETRIKVSQDGAAQSYNPVIDSAAVQDADPNNPQASTPYQLYMQTVVSEAKDQAQRMGIASDPELTKTYVADQVRAGYMGTLVHLLGGGTKGARQLGPGDIKVAQDYYNAVKDQLTAAQQDKIEPMLEMGANKDKSLDLFFDAQKAAPDNYKGQIDFLDQQYKDGKVNAEVHDLAVQRATSANSQRRSEQAEQDKNVIGQVWDSARHGGSLASLPIDTLTYIKQRGLGPQVDAIYKRNEEGGPDDSKLFSDLMRMSVEDPSSFVKMDLSMLSGQMSKGRWNTALAAQTAINRQDLKAMDQIKVAHTAMTDSLAAIRAAGINTNPKPGSDDAMRLDQFQASLIDSITAAQQARGKDKPLTRDDAHNITLGLLKDQTLAGSGYFGLPIGQTHKQVWQMTDAERGADWEISSADRTAIIQALQRKSVPVTEQNIQRMYKLSQGAAR